MCQLAHKIELQPNNKAQTHFKKAMGCARLAYNWGLAKWRENYKNGIKSNHFALKKEFNALKKEKFPFVYEVTKYATAQPFNHLNLAFQKFFKDLKLGKVSYPKFKKKREYQGSFYIGGDQIKVIQGGTKDYLKIPNLPKIKMTEKLRLRGKINGATITQRGSKFFVSIQMDTTQEEFNYTHKPIVNNHTLGIDTGIKAFASLSNGLQIQAPKPLNRLT
ncbi:RNA-guided endonuclease InsQ/TnpB family protein, partial [Helicobacter salomonis]|uniref:RNA-guided endonuclease InsQ/TnpB family protein n=1 Tax=Helicobacter salomonis TaxID=56878 RepID=UPI000CF078E8